MALLFLDLFFLVGLELAPDVDDDDEDRVLALLPPQLPPAAAAAGGMTKWPGAAAVAPPSMLAVGLPSLEAEPDDEPEVISAGGS